jgi:DNA repair exonuclease SbcCD nuclease subunit
MSIVKFVHCSDLHLGSPFKGISGTRSELGKKLINATFDAFERIVEVAVEHSVDFVLIAGDVFDSEDHSLRSRIFLRDQLERLQKYNIRCFIVCGNHDPLKSWSQAVKLPENTTIFDSGEPQTHLVERDGKPVAAVTGVSFPEAAVKKNLAKEFKREHSALPAIALLHSNVGSKAHEPYAPASLADLEQAGFDYWALGHVHTFAVLKDSSPCVVYPGCSQGTSPRETGEKGCCLVEIQDGAAPSVEFVPVDSIRYAFESLDITGFESYDEIFGGLNAVAEKLISENGNREIILRLDIIGRSSLNHELRGEDAEGVLGEELQNQLDGVTLDRVRVLTRNDFDFEALGEDNGFVTDIIAESDSVLNDEAGMSEIAAELKKIRLSCRSMPEFSEAELREVVIQARNIALDKLLEGQEL